MPDGHQPPRPSDRKVGSAPAANTSATGSMKTGASGIAGRIGGSTPVVAVLSTIGVVLRFRVNDEHRVSLFFSTFSAKN